MSEQSLWGFLFQEDQKTNTQLEERLRRWSQPPSETEREKCERAERMIRGAILADEKLKKLDITVFAKGSYANRTNIPSDSDVDVGLKINTLYYNTYPPGTSASDFGFSPATYLYPEFKKDVAQAIINYFGSDQVTVGNKAIQVHSNTARVDADVVPHTIHRRYHENRGNFEGVALLTPDGQLIYNWPVQDYENGVSKNEKASKRYKAIVRILKNLRVEMKGADIKSADNAFSYLLACLAYNIPDEFYAEESLVKLTRASLVFLREKTSNDSDVEKWVEVNGMKWLFRDTQPWTRAGTHDFLRDAVSYFQGLTK